MAKLIEFYVPANFQPPKRHSCFGGNQWREAAGLPVTRMSCGRPSVERSPDNRMIGVAARYLLCCWLVLCSLTATCVCSAQVQLPTVNLGETNFEDAFGGPGWLLQEFPEAYR
jgi:hypothetical protein